MTRAALRKAQHNLFAAGPAAHSRPHEPAKAFDRPHQPCGVPGCRAWGSFSADHGVTWVCREHDETKGGAR